MAGLIFQGLKGEVRIKPLTEFIWLDAFGLAYQEISPRIIPTILGVNDYSLTPGPDICLKQL